MTDVRDYHRALEKITAAPLELSDKDFDVLHAFNPADERRARAAVRRAQPLPIQTKDLTEQDLHHKATAPPPVFDPRLARMIGKAFSQSVVVPIGERLGTLTRRIDELETLTKQQAATLADLSSENKALGQFLADTHRRPPSREPAATKH